MFANPKMVTIIETVHAENETYTIRDDYNGCIIDGDVENSVLSPGVVVGTGSTIKNTLELQVWFLVALLW